MRTTSFARNRINRIPFSISPAGRRRGPIQPFADHFKWRLLHTLSRYQSLWNVYEQAIPLKDRYCLHQLETDWEQRKPLKEKIILVNIHLTRITLALIKALLKSGAEVEITVSPELVAHQNTLQPLLAAQIPFLPVIPDEKKKHYYDLVYDCGAGMKEIIPTRGMIELTHTPPDIYRTLPFPVITVDSSQTKAIETGLGTGDSFVRVVHSLIQQSIAALMLNGKALDQNSLRLNLTTLLNLLQVNHLFSKNKFMIFGFGKVGKGIASALESAGTPKKNIFIVDISSEAYLEAMKQGYSGLLLNAQSSESIEKIKKILPDMWAVVTATGVEGVISRYFSQRDFDRVAWLANMSTGDDFGPRFRADRILNQKKPANFMLNYPTEVMYLDAILTLFLKAGEELFTNSQLKNGLNPIATSLDQTLLADWMAQHGDAIWRHRLGQSQTKQWIKRLRQHPTPRPQDLARWMKDQGIFHHTSEPKSSADVLLTPIPRC